MAISSNSSPIDSGVVDTVGAASCSSNNSRRPESSSAATTGSCVTTGLAAIGFGAAIVFAAGIGLEGVFVTAFTFFSAKRLRITAFGTSAEGFIPLTGSAASWISGGANRPFLLLNVNPLRFATLGTACGFSSASAISIL